MTQQLLLKITHPRVSVKVDQHGARLTQNQDTGVGEGAVVESSEKIYDQRIDRAAEEDWGYRKFLKQLLQEEITNRHQNRLERRKKRVNNIIKFTGIHK